MPRGSGSPPLPHFHPHTFSSPAWKNNDGAQFFPQLMRLRVAAADADAINMRATVAWSDEYKSKQQKRKVATSRTKLSFCCLFFESFNIKAAFYLLEQQRKMSTSLLRNGCVALGRCWHSCFFHPLCPLLPPLFFFKDAKLPLLPFSSSWPQVHLKS